MRGWSDPIGKPFRVGMERLEEITVVGVVRDVGVDLLEQDEPPLVYRPRTQAMAALERFGFASSAFVVRIDGDPYSVASAVSGLVREMDSRALVRELRSMTDVVSATRNRPRAILVLIGIFTALAVVLCVIGVFGVVAYLVRQRERELAIRMALGADRGTLYAIVLSEGFWIAGVGTFAGLGISTLTLRALRSFVFDVTIFDPFVLGAAGLVAALAAISAAALPAWRAGRVQPAAVLAE